MRFTLSPAAKIFIRRKVSSGEYSSPSHVVEAAIATLEQQARIEFEPGELERLIAEGEASGFTDAATALKKRRQHRARLRRTRK